MKKTYYLLFFKLVSFFRGISDDRFEKPKALIVVNAICILLSIELLTWWTIITKHGVHISKFWLIIPVIVIVILNYNYLMSKGNWKRYEEEFKTYSNIRNRSINFFVFCFVLLVLGSLVFAFYQMSLIDWNKYR